MKNQMRDEGKELLKNLSGRFVRALPVRQGKAAEMDELMALFAPSAWGVGLEGIDIDIGMEGGHLVAGCFGAELYFAEKRSGYPEHSRLCLTRCFGLCDYESAERLAGPVLQRAAVSSRIFIALANPLDELAWVQACATARAAKANGAYVMLVAAQRAYIDNWELIEACIASTDHDDIHCLLRAEVQDPFVFLESFAWGLVPVVAKHARRDDEDMAAIKLLLEQNRAAITHVRYRKKQNTLGDALCYGAAGCEQFGLDIRDCKGVIALLDNRDYPGLTPDELVAETKAALPSISPVHVVVTKISDGEAHPKPCALNSYHDFLMIGLFDPAPIKQKQAR